jgi:Fe-Mn family superoxide dismutase
MHHIPPLPHDFRDGVPGLLSPEGFDMAWTQYMTLMLEKLNSLTAGRSPSFSVTGELA